MTDQRPACERCRYFAPDDFETYGGAGVCQRYPPVVLAAGDLIEHHRPWMEPKEWCGEFSPKGTTNIVDEIETELRSEKP
jgi:hypothetical protein